MSKKKILMGITLLFCVFLMRKLPTEAAYRVQPTEDELVIVIDPGHGGENLGTIENGFEEKRMTMLTAQAMYDELSLYDDVTVYMTHTEDVDMSLKERAEFAASAEADFLFSIHYNASVRHDLFGSEIWISSVAPYNAYGYQFGYQFLQEMSNYDLFLRGIKTKLRDKQKDDYYGIIRESVALSVPAVILEHCHVDEERDSVHCDSDEELAAFGRSDATAVAKYFGLKSTTLGVDYSAAQDLPEADGERIVRSTVVDETSPDICLIEIADTDDETGTITLNVTAADYDSPLLYYDYSYDGGLTYSALQIWPGSDALRGTYQDTIQVTLTVPSGTRPDIILRAHNLFDLVTESNRLTLLRTFLYTDNTEKENATLTDTGNQDAELSGSGLTAAKDGASSATASFLPAVNEEVAESESEVSFLDFLKICLVIVVALFVILLFSRLWAARMRRRRRRKHRKR